MHFTTLNYTPNFTLHPKLFKCTFCILNYDHCYTLHHNVKFAVMLDGKHNHMPPMWLLELTILVLNHDQNKTQIRPSYHRHHHLWPATIATQPPLFTTFYLYRSVWIGAWRDPKHQIVCEREGLIPRIRVTSFGFLDLEEGIWVFWLGDT